MPNWTNPSTAEQLFFATVRLELREDDGTACGAGTGFLVRHGRGDGTAELYLITNRHVVAGAKRVVGYFTRKCTNGGPDVGNVFWVDLTFPTLWHDHPDPAIDICTLPISRLMAVLEAGKHESAYLVAPSSTMLATQQLLDSYDAFLPIIFVGYPNGIFDRVNFTPLLRQGFTATHPALNFCGKSDFIIDASVFPGSSGSPVFAYRLGDEGRLVDYRILGILRSVLFSTDDGQLDFEEIPTALIPVITFQRFLNLGVVIKSPEIIRLLDEYDTAPPVSNSVE